MEKEFKEALGKIKEGVFQGAEKLFGEAEKIFEKAGDSVDDGLKMLIETRMKTSIDKVLDGETTSVRTSYVTPHTVVQYVSSKSKSFVSELEVLDDLQYRVDMNVNGKKYVLIGDGYYRNEITFKTKA